MSDMTANSALIAWPTRSEALSAILKGWKLVVLGAALGLLWAVTNLRSAVYLYDVQMQVTPAQHSGDSSGALNSASLASLALPSLQTGSDFQLYLDALKSRNIADRLAEDPKIMQAIFGNQWDSATQNWHEPALYRTTDKIRKYVEDLLGFPAALWHKPDGESLLGFINYYILVQQDPRRPYIARVVMSYPDRPFAIEFLADLHRATDDELRQRAIERTTDYIAYLSSVLDKVTIAEHRVALAQALSQQEKSAMIARSGAAFAAELFERPWASSYPSSPQPTRELVIRTSIGAAIGGLFAVLLYWAARRNVKIGILRKLAPTF